MAQWRPTGMDDARIRQPEPRFVTSPRVLTLIRTPDAAASSAADLVSPSTACLLAE
jgi:hypothetical protein